MSAMIPVPINKLSDGALNWAVAICASTPRYSAGAMLDLYYTDGREPLYLEEAPAGSEEWDPVQNWLQAGELIQTAGISLLAEPIEDSIDIRRFVTPGNVIESDSADLIGYRGRTPMEAGMRAYVSLFYPDSEVEVPANLVSPQIIESVLKKNGIGVYRVQHEECDPTWGYTGCDSDNFQSKEDALLAAAEYEFPSITDIEGESP